MSEKDIKIGYPKKGSPFDAASSLFLYLGSIMVLLAFYFNTPQEIWWGTLEILSSPANLTTDYFALANIGATFMNAGLMVLLSLFLIKKNKVHVTGGIVAAMFTVAGFSFFGKNLFNSIPIMLGVMLYARLVQVPFNRYLLPALFGTALGPISSEIAFNLELSPVLGISLGILAGVLAGLALPPLSAHFLRFHQGFNLYNIGFTAGIIGMFFLAVLQGFGVEVKPVSVLSSGNNDKMAIFLIGLFGCLLFYGLFLNRWRLTSYRKILGQSGRLVADFIVIAGFPIVLINMSLLGLIATFYVLFIGGELNGAVIGGIFTIAGFGAFGKHIRNVWPVLFGVFLGSFFNVNEFNATATIVTALFGTTLAPIAGVYGIIPGILAGMLHMGLVSNIGFLHAGMNLYNNGFTGGFIAAALVPLFDTFKQVQDSRRESKKTWKKIRH